MAQTKFQPLRLPDGREMKRGLINNSQTLSVGEVIIPAVQGDAAVVNTGGGTTGDLLGVVMSIVGKAGKVLEVNTHAAASDNVTVGQVNVNFIPIIGRSDEYIAGLDADAETTDNSSAYGNFAVDSTGLLIDENTYAAFGTKASKQFFSYGLIPGTIRDITGVFIANLTA